MRIDWLELLHCPSDHGASPLITVANVRSGDRLLDATLGCAICGARFALHDGIVDLSEHFADEPASASSPSVGRTVQSTRDVGSSHQTMHYPDGLPPVSAERIAALLSLTEPGARVVMCGRLAAVAHDVANLTGAQVLSVNPERDTPADDLDVLRTGGLPPIPLASASVVGFAIDLANVGLLSDVARVVRVGGRVVAPASTPLPVGCRELARDEYEWVAEIVPVALPTIQLRVAARLK